MTQKTAAETMQRVEAEREQLLRAAHRGDYVVPVVHESSPTAEAATDHVRRMRDAEHGRDRELLAARGGRKILRERDYVEPTSENSPTSEGGQSRERDKYRGYGHTSFGDEVTGSAQTPRVK